jgi:molybdenum cofactor cytidylyltransferase
VILAAGTSSRLGRPKQLLDLGGQPLVSHAVRAAMDAGLHEIVVVIGNQAERVAAALHGLPVQTVVNSRFAEGQGTSVSAGIAAVDPESEAAIVLLGDQPGVRPETIRAVAKAFAIEHPAIAAPVYGNIMGNPVLFRRDLFPELVALSGDEGARSLVRTRMSDVLRVPVAGDAPPPDIDTEEDYRSVLAGWPGED